MEQPPPLQAHSSESIFNIKMMKEEAGKVWNTHAKYTTLHPSSRGGGSPCSLGHQVRALPRHSPSPEPATLRLRQTHLLPGNIRDHLSETSLPGGRHPWAASLETVLPSPGECRAEKRDHLR